MKNLICKIFGHKYIYYTSSITPEEVRLCVRCKSLSKLRTLPHYGTGWFNLVKRTKFGAKEWLKNIRVKE